MPALRSPSTASGLFFSAALVLSSAACAPGEGDDTSEATEGEATGTSDTNAESTSSSDASESTESSSGDETGGAGECESGYWLITGTVTREMVPEAWNGEFEPLPSAHVFLQAMGWVEDGPSEYFGERDIPFESLPFDFELCVDSAIAEQYPENRDLNVSVFNHEGDEFAVGDLYSEQRDFIAGPEVHMQIPVFGMEYCGDPNSSGLCTWNN